MPIATDTSPQIETDIAIVGGGPAGLMAAETCAKAGLKVDLFESMPSTGRKFLLAGKGGLNLTHAEHWSHFVTRYQHGQHELKPMLDRFDASAVRQWAHELGVETFVGSSQRVFPVSMKAAPLLRAWLTRLRARGVRIHVRHRWLGWSGREDRDKPALRFDTPQGRLCVHAGATVLALGGGSWPQLGSDGQWVATLQSAGVPIEPLKPANCGFDVMGGWSELFSSRHAGEPVKTVGLSFEGLERRGEFVITASGIEGSLVYTMASALRDAITLRGSVGIQLDLLPDLDTSRVRAQLSRPRGGQSLSNHLRRTLGLSGVKAALLRECAPPGTFENPEALAASIKRLPIHLSSTRPLAEAISSAGGVRFDALAPSLMVRDRPGLFVAGEMLDWEAPTGGYLITACLATGRLAGQSAARWLVQNTTDRA